MQFTRKQWDHLAEVLAEVSDGVQLMDDYSGQAMYGEKCVAVVGDLESLLTFWGAAQYLLDDDGDPSDDVTHLMYAMRSDVRVDQFGRDHVYYFPGVSVEAKTSNQGTQDEQYAAEVASGRIREVWDVTDQH